MDELAVEKLRGLSTFLAKTRSARIRECAQVCLEEKHQAVTVRECAQPELCLEAQPRDCRSARIRSDQGW